MRRAFVAATVIASLGLTGLPAQAAVQVKIQDFMFTPSKLAVAEGTAITWHYVSGGTTHHTSTQNGPPNLWNTGSLLPGQTSSPVVLRGAGTYPYHCAVHPSMVGIIRVPIRVSPITGTTSTTFTIRLATAKQTGLAYDIQKRKGAGAWKSMEERRHRPGRAVHAPRRWRHVVVPVPCAPDLERGAEWLVAGEEDHDLVGVRGVQKRSNRIARFTSWIAFVTSMPRGHASVQLKVVRHRKTPVFSERILIRSWPPSSRESKMNRCALTIAAGPT